MPPGKISDQGWFYHAPLKKAEEVQKPEPLGPMSQIPDLGYMGEPSAEEANEQRRRENYIKDTDSKYIQLCKRGGRPDLIAQKLVAQSDPEKPRSYPKNEWFYLEDNMAEDRLKHEEELENKKKYESSLPEYMVHDEFKPEQHQATSFENNAVKRCQKTIIRTDVEDIPEPRPFGYGIRQARLKEKLERQAPKPTPELEEAQRVAKVSAFMQNRRHRPEEEEKNMSKILSYGYQRDWEVQAEKIKAAYKVEDQGAANIEPRESPQKERAPPTHQLNAGRILNPTERAPSSAEREAVLKLRPAGKATVKTDDLPMKPSYKKRISKGNGGDTLKPWEK